MTVRSAAAALAALCVLALPAPAHATGNGRWAVQPTPPATAVATPRLYFFLESAPGGTVTDSVRLANLTDQPLTLRLYAADAYNTAADGGFGLRDADAHQADVGAWTRAGAQTVVLPARRQADVPFTIVVPPNATPGDHVGGIVAAETLPSGRTAGADGSTVAVRQAVGARIYLRVSGAVRPGLSIDGLTGDRRGIAYTVVNTGNVHLVPQIAVESSGLFGHRILPAAPQPKVDLVPGARTRLSTPLATGWPVDVVTTKVTLTADGGVRTVATTTVLIGVWPAIAAAVLLFLLAFWLLRRRARYRRLRPRSVA
ncbi:WxL protein peptidoglycan domain-containing protein [Hamadaea tsunoensis]|uniref:WxL protein peptidoglycan domain-containing protein n=1 Tax=Hamadaea tsunoensis TaxID=53368 RepID=UPI00040C8183|nr:DUF916 domain-containing protein [Hamadaea tsunoensis]